MTEPKQSGVELFGDGEIVARAGIENRRRHAGVDISSGAVSLTSTQVEK
jgi:hypothetical protein